MIDVFTGVHNITCRKNLSEYGMDISRQHGSVQRILKLERCSMVVIEKMH